MVYKINIKKFINKIINSIMGKMESASIKRTILFIFPFYITIKLFNIINEKNTSSNRFKI